MRAWLIDLGVWAALALIMVTVSITAFSVMRPPTSAELTARYEADVRSTCQSAPATQAMPQAMRQSYCSCIVTESTSFGGVSEEEAQACRSNAARVMKDSPTLLADYRVGVSKWCQRYEALATNHSGSPTGPFCNCVARGVEGDRDNMVQFAYADRPARGALWEQTRESCGHDLYLGSDWQVEQRDGRMALFSEYPWALHGARIEFACEAGSLVFSMRWPSGKAVDPPLVVANELEAFEYLDSNKAAAAPQSYALLEQLQSMDQIDDRPYAYATVASLSTTINLKGLKAGAAKLLKECPEPQGGIAKASTVEAGVDAWRVVSPTMVTTDDIDGWQFTLGCDSVISLEVGHDALGGLSEKYPDPQGQFAAAGVPVVMTVQGGPSIEKTVVCDTPRETAMASACFIKLEHDDLLALLQGEVSIAVAGRQAPPVRYGGSASLREIAPSCDRLP